jgi:putative hydrolase of HD superfamily
MSDVNNEVLSKRLLDLQTMLNQFLDIERMIYLPDGKRTDRRETDTEHSYHLAMLAWYTCGVFPHLDKNKVIQYSLAHDLVEIHAGDVMALGRTKAEQQTKEKNEALALKKLQQEWPDFKDMTDTIETYEAQGDAEAVFVKALDKILPILHQIMTEGKTWKKYDTQRTTVIDLKDDKTEPSEEVTAIWQEFRRTIMDHDDWFNDGKAV